MGGASPSSWGVEEVVGWLQGIGLAEYSNAFVANGIDGEMLLLLSEDDLLGDLAVQSKDHRARILVSRGQLMPPTIEPLSATISLRRADSNDALLSQPHWPSAAVTIQAAVRGWRSRRHTAAARTPSRWLLCGDGPTTRRYFFNEMTLVSTYTPPPVLEKYLEAGADGVSRLRRAADEPAVEISPPGMLAPGRRPRWAQVDNGFAGVDRPRPVLEPGRAPRASVRPLPDHVVEAAPQDSVALPPPRWQPHTLPEFTILKGSKAAAAAQPAIDVKAELLGAKVLPAIGAALIPAALGSHQMGDRGKPPSGHTPFAKLLAALAEPFPADGEWDRSNWAATSVVNDLLPEDPVGVLYDQLRPALAAALAQDAAVASEADGGGIAAVVRELSSWVSDRAPGVSKAPTGRVQRRVGFGAGSGGMAADPPVQPEPEPEPEPEPSMTVEEIIGSMPLFESVRQQQRAAIIKWLVRKSFRTGELICREGDLSNEFYIIKSGIVRAVKSRGTTKEVLLKTCLIQFICIASVCVCVWLCAFCVYVTCAFAGAGTELVIISGSSRC